MSFSKKTSGGGGGGTVWGAITGDIENQTDLNSELSGLNNNKVDKSGSITQITTRNHNDLNNRDAVGNHAKIIPSSDGTTAFQITKANGTTQVIVVDTTKSRCFSISHQ
jgi:hypothetical protein